ncbi:MAG TPA: ABC transporter substrate-binding protein [Gemmatimonadaceae bacterium]|nr:ABC transporter substrate-binding protein [Gemmatimonadaceae bacterium]
MRVGTALLFASVVAACDVSRAPRVAAAYSIKPPIGTDIFADAADSGVAPVALGISRWGAGAPSVTIAAQATAFAANPDVVAVVGHGGSRDALLATSVYNHEGIAHLVPTATSSRLESSGPWTFMLAPDDNGEGQFIANYAVDSLHARRIALLYVGDEYGVGIRDGVMARLAVRGVEAVDAGVVPGVGCTSEVMTSLVVSTVRAALKRGRPDLVVLAAGKANAACILRTILSEAPGVRVLCADGVTLASASVPHLPPSLRTSVWRVTFWVPRDDAATRAFMTRARRVLGREPDAADALQYDAFMAVSSAVQAVGANRAAIRRWLETLGTTHPALRGVTGPIAFNGERASLLYMVPIAP